MGQQRRQFLQMAGMLAAGLVAGLCKPVLAWAATWNKDAFGAKTVADALKSLGAAGAAPSTDIAIEAPQIAENGAVVPVEITSNLPGHHLDRGAGREEPVPARRQVRLHGRRAALREAQREDGRDLGRARDRVRRAARRFVATREVKVTIGGCGG